MKNFITKQKNLLFFILLLFTPQLLSADGDINPFVSQTQYLENKGKNEVTFNFGKKKWQYVIVKLNGTYHKDITLKPSQSFTVYLKDMKGSRVIFDKEVYGDNPPIIENIQDDNNLKEIDLSVSVKLKSVHGASTYSAGNVEVIAFMEEPGKFYITGVTYHTDKATVLTKEPITTTQGTLTNNTNTIAKKSTRVVFKETKSIRWEKSFSHSEDIGISIGYKAGTGGGFEAMASLQASFKTDYKNGETQETVREIDEKVEIDVPPHKTYRVFTVQSRESIKIPYTLKGYVIKEVNGKYQNVNETRDDTCIFTNIFNTDCQLDDVGSNSKPIKLEL